MSGFYPNDIQGVFAFRKRDWWSPSTKEQAFDRIKGIREAVNDPDNVKRYGSYAKKHQSIARNLYVVDVTTGKRVFPKPIALKKGVGKGWRSESARHALARKGIKTSLTEEQKRAKWLVTNKKTGKKSVIQLARATPSDVDRLAKTTDKKLLSEFENSDFVQHVIGTTSVRDAQLYDLMEREINKRGLGYKAEVIVEKNEKKGDKMAERGEL